MSARSLSVGVQRLETYGDPVPALDAPYVDPFTDQAWLEQTCREVLPSLDLDSDPEALAAAVATLVAILSGEIDPAEYNLEPRADMVQGSPIRPTLPGEALSGDSVLLTTAPVAFATTAGIPVRRDGTIRTSRRRMMVIGNIVDLPSMCRGNTYTLLTYANRLLCADGREDLTVDVREDMQPPERGQSGCITSEQHVRLQGKRPRPVRTPKRDVWTGLTGHHALTYTSCATLIELAHNFDGRRYVGWRPCESYVTRPHSTKRVRKPEPIMAETADQVAAIAESQALLIAEQGGSFVIAYGSMRISVSHKARDQYRLRIGVKGELAHAMQVNVRAPQFVAAAVRNRVH